MKLFIVFVLIIAASKADLPLQQKTKGASLKPISACCDIPELGDPTPLTECSKPKLSGPAIFVTYDCELATGPISNLTTLQDEEKTHSLRELTECNDVQCIFEKSGFLVDKATLNKDAYRTHLRKWSENHKGWSDAIEKAIKDCVDKELRQYLEYPCRAYDVFTCTSIAMLKKCPKDSWKC